MFLNNPLGYKQKDLEYDRGLLLMAVPYKKCAILTKTPYKNAILRQNLLIKNVRIG